MKVIYLWKRRISLKTTSTLTLLKKEMELYLHVLVSVCQFCGRNMFMYLNLTDVIAKKFQKKLLPQNTSPKYFHKITSRENTRNYFQCSHKENSIHISWRNNNFHWKNIATDYCLQKKYLPGKITISRRKI